MLSFPSTVRIWLAAAPVDLRKSFDTLAELVRQRLQHDPLSGHLFVFRNLRGDRVKLLYWDEDGFVIVYKKQEEECPPSFAFTGFRELAHNRALRLAGVAAVAANSPAYDSRRRPMSRAATALVPPRAHRSRRFPSNCGIG
jgi:hypothetical protein